MVKKPLNLNNEKLNWLNFKRLVELVSADLKNCKLFETNPEKFLTKFALDLDPYLAKEAVDVYLKKRKSIDNPYLTQACKLIQPIYEDIAQRVDITNFTAPQFQKWIQRKKKALAWESRATRKILPHFNASVMFELSQGCSGQCDFCCLDTRPLTKTYRYTEDNQKFWQEILKATKEEIGNAASVGACYFATEPLDNPDYEKFIADFYQVFQTFPQTTTVKGAADVKRIKRLMKQLGMKELQKAKLRFSIISLEQLKAIYQNYTKEELAYIELLINNKESIHSYSDSGRARKLHGKRGGKEHFETAPSVCLIGFLVNLCTKAISLIVPRKPSDRYPLGMETIFSENFSTPNEYRDLIQKVMQTYMPLKINENHKLCFCSGISMQSKGNTVTFWGDNIKRSLSLSKETQIIAKKLQKEAYLVNNIFKEKTYSIFLQKSILTQLQHLYDLGFLEVVS
jgi:radical SAM family RiPP maturation amino acid epimerase